MIRKTRLITQYVFYPNRLFYMLSQHQYYHCTNGFLYLRAIDHIILTQTLRPASDSLGHYTSFILLLLKLPREMTLVESSQPELNASLMAFRVIYYSWAEQYVFV